MGGSDSNTKAIIDPNAHSNSQPQQQQNQQNPQAVLEKTKDGLRSLIQQRLGPNTTTFTREQYNETLFVFEQWGVGQVRDTPLSAR